MRSSKTLVPRVGVASLCSPLEVGADRAPQAAERSGAAAPSGRLRGRRAGTRRPAREVVGRRAEAGRGARPRRGAGGHELVRGLPGPRSPGGMPCAGAALVAARHGDRRPVRRATIDGLFEAVGRAVSGRVRTVGVARLPDRARAFLRAAALAISLAAGADRTGRASRRRHDARSPPTRLALKKAIGPRIVPLDLPQLLAAPAKCRTKQVGAQWQDVVGRAAACKVAEADGLDSMKFYAAVRSSSTGTASTP